MKIDNFKTLGNLFTQDDSLDREETTSLQEFIEDLESVRSSLIAKLKSGTFVYEVAKTKKGNTYYKGNDKGNMSLGIILMKGSNSIFTISQVITKTTLRDFFTTLDYTKNSELDPNGVYFVKETRVEEDGYPQLVLEELVLNGVVVGERVKNYREREYGESQTKHREALLCLSEYVLGGMEIMYDRNANVLDLDTIGDVKLKNLNIDKENLRNNIDTYITDLVLREQMRIERIVKKGPEQK